jgi:murein DD-endopeptidase MepM/ murein hydrolase activator NlpD
VHGRPRLRAALAAVVIAAFAAPVAASASPPADPAPADPPVTTPPSTPPTSPPVSDPPATTPETTPSSTPSQETGPTLPTDSTVPVTTATTLPPISVPDLGPPPDGSGDGDEGPVSSEPIVGFTGGGYVRGRPSISLTEWGWQQPILFSGVVAPNAARSAAVEAREVADGKALAALDVQAAADAAALTADRADAAASSAARAATNAEALEQRLIDEVAVADAELDEAAAVLYANADELNIASTVAVLTGESSERRTRMTTYARSLIDGRRDDQEVLAAKLDDATEARVAAVAQRATARQAAVERRAEAVAAQTVADEATADAAIAVNFADQLDGAGAQNRAIGGTLPELQALANAERLAFPVQGQFEFADSWGAERDGGARRHKGVDIIAPSGVPLVAVEDGVVTYRQNSLGGITLWLSGVSGNRYYYAHLDRYRSDLPEGSPVRAGEVIGFNGATGNARFSVPHLHFEVHPRGGDAVNPYPLMRALAEADNAARAAGVLPVDPLPPTTLPPETVPDAVTGEPAPPADEAAQVR